MIYWDMGVINHNPQHYNVHVCNVSVGAGNVCSTLYSLPQPSWAWLSGLETEENAALGLYDSLCHAYGMQHIGYGLWLIGRVCHSDSFD